MGFSTLYKSVLIEELNAAFRKCSVHTAGKYLSGICQMKIQGKGQFKIYHLIRLGKGVTVPVVTGKKTHYLSSDTNQPLAFRRQLERQQVEDII